jgi:Ni/Fe-hydrogenase subunit HybB-like protein
MRRVELYPSLKLMAICFLGLILISKAEILNDPKVIFLALIISVSAVLIEKWRGPYY